MTLKANYDDIASFKTPTQLRNDAKLAMVQTDIKRIDLVLLSGTEKELKRISNRKRVDFIL